jgi:hypothetical protein
MRAVRRFLIQRYLRIFEVSVSHTSRLQRIDPYSSLIHHPTHGGHKSLALELLSKPVAQPGAAILPVNAVVCSTTPAK